MRKLHTKVTKVVKVTDEGYESYKSYRRKLRTKIRRRLFYDIAAGAGVRQKKLQKGLANKCKPCYNGIK